MLKEKVMGYQNLFNKLKAWSINSLNILQSMSVLLLIFIFLSIAFPRFFTILNLTNLIKQQVPNLIAAVGMTCILISGEIDISIGASLGLISVMTAEASIRWGMLPAIVIGILVGTFVGLVNGFLVVKGKMPSFIVTLGTMYVTRAISYVATKGITIGHLPDNFVNLYVTTILKIPVVYILTIGIYLIAYVVLTKMIFGKQLVAVGSNRKVADLSGINSGVIKFKVFILMGFLTGIVGVLVTSRLGGAQAELTGVGFEFEIIAAVIIGGCSLYGGEGSILLSIIGVFILALIRNGLNLAHANVYWQDFVTGAVIVFAVFLDIWRRRIRERVDLLRKV